MDTNKTPELGRHSCSDTPIAAAIPMPQLPNDGLWPPATPADQVPTEGLGPGVVEQPVPDLDEVSRGATRREIDRSLCLCGAYEVVNPETGEAVRATGCATPTRRMFAPGHDAKLKSLLIWAGARDYRVREVGGTGRLHRPTTIAARYGFGSQVERGIGRARGR